MCARQHKSFKICVRPVLGEYMQFYSRGAAWRFIAVRLDPAGFGDQKASTGLPVVREI